MLLVKTDINGVEQWNQNFGGTGDDRGMSVRQTNDGGYIVCGGTTSNTAGPWDSDVYLIKTDINGVEQWQKTFGGTSNDLGSSVKQTTDGGFIICGVTESFNTLNLNGAYSVYLIKTDGNGNELWNKTFGGTNEERGYSVQQTTDGGYIISGTTLSFANGIADVYLIKTDGSGNELWNKTFGGTYEDVGVDVQQTTDGGYIITGTTSTFGNGNLQLIPNWARNPTGNPTENPDGYADNYSDNPNEDGTGNVSTNDGYSSSENLDF